MLSPRIAERYVIATSDVEAFARKLQEEGVMVSDPQDPPSVVPDDPKDDYLIALVRESHSNVLVTRDRHFEKVTVEDISIVTPARALALLA